MTLWRNNMGMNKREYQERISDLENQIAIYKDHLSFEQSRGEGFKENIRSKKRIIEDHVAEIQSMQLLIDRYSDRVELLEDKFKFLADRITQYQKELAEEHKNADVIDQQKIESKIQAIETVKILMEM